MSDAQNYYDSLLADGHDHTSALGDTQQHYPEFAVANTAASMLVGVPTDNLPSTQIQNDNSNKKMLIIGGSIGGGVLLVIGVVTFLLLSGSTATMVGTWVDSDGTSFTLYEDGTFSNAAFSADEDNWTASWDVNGDILTINFEGGDEWITQTTRFFMSSDGDAVWTQTFVEASDGSNYSTGPSCSLIVRESLIERDYTTSEDFKGRYESSKPEWCS
tara:strand:+ start:1705 stop:2352 length:648 start_codon:yes stop_codon:yes gene_type:complete